MIWGVWREGAGGGAFPLGGLRGGFSSNWLIVVCDDYHVLAWGDGGLGRMV